METTKQISEQMNSDMFDRIPKAIYQIKGFTGTEIRQAKESFTHNGYEVSEFGNLLEVRRKS